MSEPTPPKCCEDGLPDPAPLSDEQIARIGKALAFSTLLVLLVIPALIVLIENSREALHSAVLKRLGRQRRPEHAAARI